MYSENTEINIPYISCIKIKGKPIISPVMTSKVREECREFKRKALQIERKLQRNKVFAKCLEDLGKLQKQTEDLVDSRPVINTLENQITINEVQNSEITENAGKNLIMFKNLTSETIDVTEYVDQEVRVLSNCSNISSEVNQESSPRPKLLRSNSYTLESPSPILLAHLEREAAQLNSSLDQSLNLSLSISPETVIDNETPPTTQEIIETDVKIEHVNITTPINSSIDKLDPINSDLEPKLIEALKQLPENCVKTILEIFNKQKDNHAETIQQISETFLKSSIENIPNPLSLSITSNQSVYYSVLNSPSLEENIVHVNNVRNNSQLSKTDDLSKREWAACKIGAAAKGYLVRRLIKTEKVQSLIDTIKDALLCALQLHSAQIIDESDIELHRRLIQQVSAACYAFHDVFFMLSTKEQMAIISLDRQRRLEKAKRPPSSARSSLSGNIKSSR